MSQLTQGIDYLKMSSEKEHFDFVKFMTNDERGGFLILPLTAKIVLASFQVIIWTIGAIMKLVIFKSFKKISERPINILIILSQVFDFLPHTLIVANFLMMIPESSSSVQFLERNLGIKLNINTYCWSYYYLNFFWSAYANFSSLGIAVCRYFFIKKPGSVKKQSQIKNLLKTIILGGFLASIMTSWVSGRGVSTSRLSYNSCLGVSEKFQVSPDCFSHFKLHCNL